MSNIYDVIVIGLGAAGATAASTLAQAGKRVLGLEAMTRVGGRVHSVPVLGGKAELGAEWIHGQRPSRVYDAAVKGQVALDTQPTGAKMFRSDGSKPSEYHQKLLAELRELSYIDKDSRPETPLPMGTYVIDRVTKHIKENYPEIQKDPDYIQQLLNFLSLLQNNYHACDDWNEVSSWNNYTLPEGEENLSWQHYGYETFFDILLNTHNGGPGLPSLTMKLGTEVNRILWSCEPSSPVRVQTTAGEFLADTALVTVSLGVLKNRHMTMFEPKLPLEKASAIKNIAYGLMDKIILTFNDPWWANDAFFLAFVWKGEDVKKLRKEDLWITKIFGITGPLGSKNSIILWTSSDTARLVETLPDEEVTEKCMKLLRIFLGKTYDLTDAVGILRSTWNSNPYTLGSYSYDHVSLPSYPTAREDLASPLLDSAGRPRVLFAGEACHKNYYSTVHGASETGYREAMRILKEEGECKL